MCGALNVPVLSRPSALFSPGTLACGADDVLGARRISDLTWRSEMALESGKSVDWD